MVGRPKHVAWFLAAGILALVGAAVLTGRSTESCAEWQRRYEAARPEGGAVGTLDFVNHGPLAQLEADRPEGCEVPD